MSETGTMHGVLAKLVRGDRLSAGEAEQVVEYVLGGGADDAQIGAMLSMIAMRGASVDEMVGGARSMRRHVTGVGRPAGKEALAVVDTCGTGGAPKTFNVSTIAAVVTAAAAEGKVLVAKHGSTSRTGRGSSEVLGRIGVNTDATPAQETACLEACGVCFCFAPKHHPAMKHAAGARKSVGFPTIFNLLGPLTNPAGADRQLIGAYSVEMAEKIALTLARLGVERALVVSSHDGLDELTTTETNQTFEVERGGVRARVLDARGLGLARVGIDELRVSSVEQAVEVFKGVVSGQERGPRREMVLLSVAGALWVGGVVEQIGEGVALGARAIDSGAAQKTLGVLCEVSHE